MPVDNAFIVYAWTDQDDCNLLNCPPAYWLMDELTKDQEAFVEQLPDNHINAAAEELKSRKDMAKTLSEQYKASVLSDGDYQQRKRIAYDLWLNEAGIEYAKRFLAKAERHIKKLCPHFSAL